MLSVYKEKGISPFEFLQHQKPGDILLQEIQENLQISYQQIGGKELYEVLLRHDGEKIHEAMEMGFSPEMMTKLTLSIVKKAITDAQQSGYRGGLSINIGESEIKSELFPQQVLRILRENNHPSHTITFEILENVPLEDFQNPFVRKNMDHLSKEGVSFALDDINTRPNSEQSLLLHLLETDSHLREWFTKFKFEMMEKMSPKTQDIMNIALESRKTLVIEKGSQKEFERISREIRDQSAFFWKVSSERRGTISPQNFENGGKTEMPES